MIALIEHVLSMSFEPSMLLQNLAATADVLILLGSFSDEKRPLRRAAREFLLLFIALVVMNGLWELAFEAMGSFFVSHFLLLAGYAAAIRQLKQKSYIVSIILFYAIDMGMIIFSSIFPKLFAIYAYGRSAEILFRNLTVLLTIAAAAFFRRCSILRFHNITSVSAVYAVLTGGTTVLLSLLYFIWQENCNWFGYLAAAVSFFCILLMNLVAYYLNYSLCLFHEQEKQLLLENASMNRYREMLRLNQQNLEDIRKIRHDMKNHFQYINVLLREKRYAEAEKYFDTLRSSTLQQLSYIDCGNRVISAILNLEAAKAREHGVTLDYRVMAAQELPLAEDDMCALATNLIDNAIEACVRQHIPNGKVEVGVNQKGSQLYLCVRNPVDISVGEKALLSLKTTKAEKSMHGYGHKIVDNIVQKYNGILNRSVCDGQYIVDISLDLQWAQQQVAGCQSEGERVEA